MTKKELLEQIKQQNETYLEGEDDVGCILTIKNDRMKQDETITFDMEDAQYKIEFIDSAYDDNLNNKGASFIHITDVRFYRWD